MSPETKMFSHAGGEKAGLFPDRMFRIFFLMVLMAAGRIEESLAQVSIFSENVGSPSASITTVANYSGWQNNASLTFSNGGLTNAADVRNSSTSSGYTGASGTGNVFFTATSGSYGFSIENINASAYSGLTLTYAYRKESGSVLPSFSVDYWNGSAWVNLSNTATALFNQTASATVGWYVAKVLNLPVAAQINGLKIRFVKSGSIAIRLDDISLKGNATSVLSPPALTPASNAIVDTNFSITFPEDTAWRNGISSITVNGTLLDSAAYYDMPGALIFSPASSGLLQSSGAKTIIIYSNGYATASVIQTLTAGVPKRLSLQTQPGAPLYNGGSLSVQPVVRILDRYDNLTGINTLITAFVASGSWLLGCIDTAQSLSGIATFSGLTASASGAVTGAGILFSATLLPDVTAIASIGFNIPSPTNDYISGATPVSCGTSVTFNNTAATNDVLPFSCGPDPIPIGTHKGVWFKVTPSSPGALTVSTCLSGTAIDTYLRVFTLDECRQLAACISYNDENLSCNSLGSSYLTFNAGANITYYILCGLYDNTVQPGNITLDVHCDGDSIWENFEAGTKTGYAAGTVTCKAGSWNFTNALLTTNTATDFIYDAQSARILSTGNIAMNFDLPSGIGSVSLSHGMYNLDAGGSWRLEASRDSGASWTAFQSQEYASTNDIFSRQTIDVNLPGPARFRIVKRGAAGNTTRLNIDNISVSPYDPLSLPAISQSACDSFSWYGVTYTQSGFYSKSGLVNGQGYDSTAYMNLTILLSSSSFVNISACNNYSWNGVMYTESGLYSYKSINAAGCDSTAYLQLRINKSGVSIDSISACVSYIWNGNSYTSSGSYTQSGLVSAAGCDSSAVLNLTINHPDSSLLTVTGCGSYLWNGNTFTTSGRYRQVGMLTAKGCDSIAILQLAITPTTSSILTIVTCNGYVWDGNAYTTSGLYSKANLTNALGCDSIAYLSLTILNSSSSVNNVSACESYTWNGTVYTESGNYTRAGFTNRQGCDSLAYLNLTILTASVSEVVHTACDNYLWNGMTYTVSGSYTKTDFINVAGCDSTAILLLTINNRNVSFADVSACNSYLWSGNTYTASGSYSIGGFINAQGCDSMAILNLTLLRSSSSVSYATSCDAYAWNGITYTATGMYTKSGLVNAAGCDSTAVLDLKMLKSSFSQDSVSVCAVYTWNGNTYYESGTYTKSGLVNAAGCDSIAYLTLSILPVPEVGNIIGYASLCKGSAYEFVVENDDGSGFWSSSDNSVATVGNTGIVTGITEGNAVIRYVLTSPSCGSDTAYYSVVTTVCISTTLMVKAYLEGLLRPSSNQMLATLYDLGESVDPTAADTIEINLWSVSGLSNAAPDFSVRTILHTDGSASEVLPDSLIGKSFYIALRHRNSIETWSAMPVLITSFTLYDFRNSLSKAYDDGTNPPMKQIGPGRFAFYAGDVNQDGTADLLDMNETYNAATNFLFGYYAVDCDGDGEVGVLDFNLIFNNSIAFIFYSRPY